MNPDNPKAAAKEFLLEDYQQLHVDYWNNEQSGESRVNWFIGIVTAVVGGLLALASADSHPKGAFLRLIAVGGLLALLAFGIITLIRMIKRNEASDRYKAGLARVRLLFKKHFDDGEILVGYDPHPHSPVKGIRKASGLAHTVAIINSLILAGLVAVLAYPFPSDPTFHALTPARLAGICGVAATAFIVSAIGQFIAIPKRP